MTGALSIGLYKEARALSTTWALAAASLVALSFWRTSPAFELGVAAYLAGAVFLGAESIGHEYSNRTLSMLLSQPIDRRRLYAQKFDAVLPLLEGGFKIEKPGGGFYLWLPTPIDDAEFVRRLQHEYNVLALPGSYLAREAQGRNPGRNHVRMALVAPLDECVEGIERTMRFARKL